MNFFKSVLSDDPVSLEPDQDNPNPNPSRDDTSGGWSFGGLIKNFAARSESVLETYRRDLKEFGSGLRNETDNLREIASRAVKEREAGASVAHGSLESVTHALDEVIKSTGEIVSKESLEFASDGESEALDKKQSLVTYSWFHSQLSLIQNDANTFCQEPDGADEYNEWKLRFHLGDKKGEIDELIRGNGALEGEYKRRVVPGIVDPETFWYRYFYKVHKLEQQDRMRANLMGTENPDDDDEEELSWDVDDDDNGDRGIQQKTGVKVDGSGSVGSGDRTWNHLAKQEGSSSKSHDGVDKNNIRDSNSKSNEKLSSVENMRSEVVEGRIDQKMTLEESGLKNYDDIVLPLDEKMDLEGRGESLKKSDASAKVNEEDSEWDEIEDVGSGDEKKISVVDGDATIRAELRKFIGAAVDDEELSWDIEDDDEPAKA